MLVTLIGRAAAAAAAAAAQTQTQQQQLLPLAALQLLQAAARPLAALQLDHHPQQQQRQQQHPQLQLQLQQQLQRQQLQQQQQQQWRALRTSAPASDLRDFLDGADPATVSTGRAWLARELRGKSWDDLHKLWYLCLKERNMLLTQMRWGERRQRETQHASPHLSAHLARYRRVKLSMNRIKHVLGERASNEADAVRATDMRRVIHYM